MLVVCMFVSAERDESRLCCALPNFVTAVLPTKPSWQASALSAFLTASIGVRLLLGIWVVAGRVDFCSAFCCCYAHAAGKDVLW
jgi:hypothetical protein